LAARLGQPFGLAQMNWMAAVVAQCAGDAAQVREHTTVLIRLCREHEIGFWLSGARVLEGWALAAEGHQDGTAIIRQGVQNWRSSGVKLFEPYHFGLLAPAYAGDDNPAEALASLDAADAQIQRSGERWYAAELLRLRAKLGPRPADREAAGSAESCLGRALALAQQQDAKSLALRAATDLARLWRDQGHVISAYDLLAPLHGWFTEGLDTADLREAEALLSALALHLGGGASHDLVA
jgi:adenylate cyclase